MVEKKIGMNNPISRTVGFCGQYIQINCNGSEAADLVDFLCADLSVQENVSSRTICELIIAEKGRDMSLCRDDMQLYKGISQHGLAYALINEIIFQCIQDNSTGHALHAAAVQTEVGTVLLPGGSGSGKSTLAAWLALCGFIYLTDELVVLSKDGRHIHPFIRPVSLRQAGASALASSLNITDHKVLAGDNGFMVPRSLLNPDTPDVRPAAPRISLILFPCYRKDAVSELTQLTSGLGCSRLIACYVNARNIPNYGISRLTGITRNIPIWQLTYGSFIGLQFLLADTLPEFFRETVV